MISIEELRNVEVADAYKAGNRAGQLVRRGTDVVFHYSDEYLSTAGEAIAWTLPKSPTPAIGTAGSVPPFFAGLLPEGIRLSGAVAATKTSVDDHLTILLSIGNNLIGDVQVVAHGEKPDNKQPVVDPSNPKTNFGNLFDALSGRDSISIDASGIPGVQAKVSAQPLSSPVATLAGPAILKLSPRRKFPLLIENEHFFLDVASRSGLTIPAHHLFYDSTGTSGLLVDRFDRTGNSRLAQEDACQIMGEYPAAKYRLKSESVITELSARVEAGGGSSRQARLELLRLTAFSYAIGNGDLHGKNYSVHQTPDGTWRVTPAYDLLCTQPYAGWRDPMALTLFGRNNRWTAAHLIDAGSRLAIPARATQRMLDEVCSGVREGAANVEAIGFDTKTTARLAKQLIARAADLSPTRSA